MHREASTSIPTKNEAGASRVAEGGESMPGTCGIMSDGIVPLRRKSEERSALARIDVAAVKMLSHGRATNLQTARATVILADLRAQRDQMALLVAKLRGRTLTDEAQFDAANATLIAAINQGIVQIDLFVARCRVLTEQAFATP